MLALPGRERRGLDEATETWHTREHRRGAGMLVTSAGAGRWNAPHGLTVDGDRVEHPTAWRDSSRASPASSERPAANLIDFAPDGSATAAFVFPSCASGRAAHRADPLASDQDSALYWPLRFRR